MKITRSKVGDCLNCKYLSIYYDECVSPEGCINCPLHKEVNGQFATCVCLQETELDYCEYFERYDNES